MRGKKWRTTYVDANSPKCTTEWMSIDIQRMHVKNANLAKRNIFNLMFCSYWFRFLFLSRMFLHRFFSRFAEFQMMHAVFAAIFFTVSVDLDLILQFFSSSIYSFGKKPSLAIFSATKIELTSIRRMHAKIKYGNFRWKSNLALKRDSFPMAFGGTNCWHRLTYRSA